MNMIEIQRHLRANTEVAIKAVNGEYYPSVVIDCVTELFIKGDSFRIDGSFVSTMLIPWTAIAAILFKDESVKE